MIVASNSALSDVRFAQMTLSQPALRSRTLSARVVQRRREVLWAWLSLGMLILCWDVCLRLDQHVPLPRARIQHAGVEADAAPGPGRSSDSQ